MEQIRRRFQGPLRLLLLGVVAVALLGACQVVNLLFGVTIDNRIKDFSDGYTSGSYATLYKNFSDNTAQKNAMKDPTFWDSTPFAAGNQPQALKTYSLKGSTVTGTFSNHYVSYDLTMEMEQTGMDWYILSITLSPKFPTSAGPTVIKRIQ
jgi:hypothetical protein